MMNLNDDTHQIAIKTKPFYEKMMIHCLLSFHRKQNISMKVCRRELWTNSTKNTQKPSPYKAKLPLSRAS